MGESYMIWSTDPHLSLFTNYELHTNHLSGNHIVSKGITTLLSVLSNFKIGKRIVFKQSKTLASVNYDSGSPKKPMWHSVCMSENAAFINNES